MWAPKENEFSLSFDKMIIVDLRCKENVRMQRKALINHRIYSVCLRAHSSLTKVIACKAKARGLVLALS